LSSSKLELFEYSEQPYYGPRLQDVDVDVDVEQMYERRP